MMLSKSIDTEAVLNQDRYEQEMKGSFSSKYELCSKLLRLKVYEPKQKRKMDET